MLKAIFVTSKIVKGSDEKSLIVTGELQEGEIDAGMFLKIAFNSTFGMTVPIVEVKNVFENQMVLVLDCEDKEGLDFVEAMNFEHEWVEIQEEE